MNNSAKLRALLDNTDTRVIAVTGLSKNAGKTSILNWLIKSNPLHQYGILSTGRDGEDIDTVFATPKPKVNLIKGSIFCCDTNSLKHHGSSITILQSIKQLSAPKELWLVKCDMDLETEITGPASVQNQIACVHLMQKWGANKVIIDGSIDRKSIVLSPLIDTIILAAGASFGDVDQIRTELKRLQLLCAIKVSDIMPPKRLRNRNTVLWFNGSIWHDTTHESLLNNDELLEILRTEKARVVYIPTAITDNSYSRMSALFKDNGIGIIIRHPYNLKLGLSNLQNLLSRSNVLATIPFCLKAIALNSTGIGSSSIYREVLKHKLEEDFSNCILIDIMEAYE